MAMTPMWHSGAGSVKAGYDIPEIMTEATVRRLFEESKCAAHRLHPVCAGESYSPPAANRNRKFVDSLLEGSGFELLVPRR
jgi:hypothetical protein